MEGRRGQKNNFFIIQLWSLKVSQRGKTHLSKGSSHGESVLVCVSLHSAYVYLRHIKQNKGLIEPIVKKANKNQIIKISSSRAWCPSWKNRIPVVAGYGPLCGKEPGPTHVPTVTLSDICNAIDLVAMDNFLEMLWSGLLQQGYFGAASCWLGSAHLGHTPKHLWPGMARIPLGQGSHRSRWKCA